MKFRVPLDLEPDDRLALVEGRLISRTGVDVVKQFIASYAEAVALDRDFMQAQLLAAGLDLEGEADDQTVSQLILWVSDRIEHIGVANDPVAVYEQTLAVLVILKQLVDSGIYKLGLVLDFLKTVYPLTYTLLARHCQEEST